MAAAVVDGRDTSLPVPSIETGVTPFGGQFSLATTQLDDQDDKTILFGPFPNDCYIVKLEIYIDTSQTSALIWDFSRGDLDGTVDSGGELIDGSTAGQSAAGGDSLDLDNLMFDMGGGKYLMAHIQTAAGTPAAATLTVYGEYVNGLLRHNVD
jgi:hypothetical protein